MGRGAADSILYGDFGRTTQLIPDDETFGLPPRSSIGIDGRIIKKVTRHLSLNIDTAPIQYDLGYQVFIPEAAGGVGVFPLLRDAALDPSTHQLRPMAPGAELNWLATKLRIADDQRLPNWSKTFNDAVDASGVTEAPEELGLQAKTLLLRLLADSPYSNFSKAELEEALIAAIRLQAGND